jgi:hypothetical protein
VSSSTKSSTFDKPCFSIPGTAIFFRNIERQQREHHTLILRYTASYLEVPGIELRHVPPFSDLGSVGYFLSSSPD